MNMPKYFSLLLLFCLMSCDKSTTHELNVCYMSNGIPWIDNPSYVLFDFERTGDTSSLYFSYQIKGLASAFVSDVILDNPIPYTLVSDIDSVGRFKIAIDYKDYVNDYLDYGICVELMTQ